MVRCSNCNAVIPPTSTRCPRCGSAAPTLPIGDGTGVHISQPVPARLLQPGTQVGPYRIAGLLGEGGMSAVYDAWDTVLERPVALKSLHPFLIGDEPIARRFVQEARIGRAWNHPHVGRVFDFVRTEDVLALVMERIEGPTLTELLASWQGGLPLPELVQVAQGLLAGLRAAHEHGVVHRDLKPGNVMVEHRDGVLHPRIIDFGIARVIEGTTYTLTGAVLGTCRYMSPEQVHSEPVGPAADLYSFGVVLYELAVGWPPFDDDNAFALMMAHATREPEPPRALRPDLPAELEALILALLHKDPAKRPDAAAVAERLTAIHVVRTAPAEIRAGDGPNRHFFLAVPGGSFQYGPSRRSVQLDGFAVDRTPVTNGQFKRFLEATDYRPTDAADFLHHWPSLDGPADAIRDHPVTWVSLEDAHAYCGWLGTRLPSEAEWERVARSTDGRKYPWGKDPPDASHANHRTGSTTPVTAHPKGAAACGALDLAGNVWEWTADEERSGAIEHGPEHNPRFATTPDSRAVIVRGGSFFFGIDALKTTARSTRTAKERSNQVGFRTVR